MNWVLFGWGVMGGACATVAIVHLIVWLKRPADYGNALFSVIALAIAVVSVFEVMSMKATSVHQYVALVRWGQVPIFVLVTTVVVFMRVYFGAGRLWLAYAVFGASALLLTVELSSDLSVRFAEAPVLRQLEFIGHERVTVAQGQATAWEALDVSRLILYLAYLLDVSVAVWRRGGPVARRRAVLIGGSVVVATLAAATHSELIDLGFIHSPYLISPFCLIFVGTMGYELSDSLYKATELESQVVVSAGLLRQTEQRIELAADAAGLGFWQWRLGDRRIWMNEQCLRILGFDDPESVNLRRVLRKVRPEDRRLMSRAINRALQGERASFLEEFHIKRSDGSTQWISVRGQVDVDDAGRLIVLRGVLRDVTRESQAEAQLRQVVESSPNAIVVADAEGKVLFANGQSVKMFGYAHDELLRCAFDKLVLDPLHSGDGVLQRNSFNRPDAGGIIVLSNLYGVRKDGGRFPIEVYVTPLEAQRGAQLLITIIDISSRREAENEATTRRNELTHLSRVAMLGELYQPLAAILSNAQAAQRFLERDPANIGEVREILADIVDADRRAGEVIGRLRAMLRKDTAGRRPIDMNDVTLEILRLMRSDLLNRHVLVRTEFAPDLPAVMADRVHLQQILVNLVMNACDAMADVPRDDRVVRVTTSLRNDGFVEVGVTDHGSGIPAGQLETIFEPFMTTKAHGMGVGLSVSRTIVRSHGGSIHAFNTPPHGATFRFSIPVSRELST